MVTVDQGRSLVQSALASCRIDPTIVRPLKPACQGTWADIRRQQRHGTLA